MAEKKPETEKTKISKNLQEIIGKIEKLTVLELSELVKALEEKFGVSAALLAAVAPAAAPPSGEAKEKAEEKDTFDVILLSAGGNKISVIKTVREIKPDLGLKDAKTLVDEAPKPLLTGAKKEEAEEAKKKLEGAGATVELK